MSQDTQTKHAYEHAAKIDKEAREDGLAEDATNAAALKADNHTGQENMRPVGGDLIEAAEIKDVYGLLPEWHKDELRRLLVVILLKISAGLIFFTLIYRSGLLLPYLHCNL